MDEFIQAVHNDTFERKHYLMGTTIMSHAVKDVVMRYTVKKYAKFVKTKMVKDWIDKNKLYEPWVIKLLMKSYHANLSS